MLHLHLHLLIYKEKLYCEVFKGCGHGRDGVSVGACSPSPSPC